MTSGADMTYSGGMGRPLSYPIRVDVPYPERLSRGLVLVKWILAIPHLVILYLLGYAILVTWLIALFAILITGKYPVGLFRFHVGVRRWQVNASSYTWLLRDEYPPFSFDEGQYPTVYEVDPPENLNRWLVLIKWLLLIPHYVMVYLLTIGAVVAVIIAWFAILITGRYPQSLFKYVAARLRWNERMVGYFLLMTDEYPPFSFD